ncbi:MAG: putative 5'-3'exonuclease20 [Satyrvirus sp.]|uniref:Putative 5'-3'exonuclease20 n=1 Tax=Satyrvirus sp. TaxID=2487771 RepID=A0A3G5AGK8_9VIRU|nr:MAG: putative 5'-3'exonuclease20 [Satyrvirus sp.]
MGIEEYFSTLVKNNVTSTAIKSNFSDKMHVNHFLIDFNSIIHVSSQKVVTDINIFLQLVLRNLYGHRDTTNIIFTEKFEKYNMQDIQKKITQNSDPNDVVAMFQEHFNEKYVDKLVITAVINTVLHLVRIYCQNKSLETLLLAIDGVPSKGKMVEQRQRRYLGAITEKYKKKILAKYKNYLLEQEDYVYLATERGIKWSRNKITPGTAFMHKLVAYLTSEKIQSKFKVNRPNLKIVVSSMYEVGEGEKKIVNYANKYLKNTNGTIIVYSPDADMILLCMLLPTKNVFMLRHNQQTSTVQTSIYDLIDIGMLKNNMSYYINNHPSYSKEDFETDRIIRDIVCMSTLFGNDFVPKILTINVKSGFQSIMDAYLKTLIKLKDKGYYLVKNSNSHFRLNFIFLKCIIRFLVPEENYFIQHNDLYAKYIKMDQIKNAFDYMAINSENIVSIFNEFRQEYENLKRVIKFNGNFTYFEKNDEFMSSLKKSIIMTMDSQTTNTEMINLLKKYYYKYKDFPRLNINLNTWSHSIDDYKHKQALKDKKLNDYQKEVYKFDNMLDEYYIKFNAQTLDLSPDKINNYYKNYFGIELFDKNNKLTKEAVQLMHDYVEGILWVFDYYFNDITYINKWYYEHEKAPLLQHLLIFLDNSTVEYFAKMYEDLDNYHIKNLKKYFNPVEQLMYVSPMTDDVLKLLPSNYRNYIMSDNLDPFLKNYFVDIDELTSRLWKEKVSNDIDCHGIIHFNKCLVKSIQKPTATDDELFLKIVNKVKPNEVSTKRSKNGEPNF